MSKVKIVRILIMEGDSLWIKRTLQQSRIHPEAPFAVGELKIEEVQRIYPHNVRDIDTFIKRLMKYIDPIVTAEKEILSEMGKEVIQDDRQSTPKD